MNSQGNPLCLTRELLHGFRKVIESEPTTCIGMNGAAKADPIEMLTSRKAICRQNHVFEYKVEEVKPVTNQKSSGRCWLFAALNMIRVPFMKNLTIEEFEFSQSHLFFWDKVERCNFFLNTMLEALKGGEKIEDRLISFLLHDPISDGGQWDMFVNLVNKYGLMPKACFPETFCAQNSERLSSILRTKLRDYTKEMHDLLEKDPEHDMTVFITERMQEVYRVIAICLGVPTEKFTWEYYDKTKNYHSVKNVTPVEFYQEHVKPVFDLEKKVCIVNDPRKSSPYQTASTVHCLGNMVGGRTIIYNNQPVELLLEVTGASIKDGEPVWFGCDVFQRFSKKLSMQDLDVLDYKTLFGTDVGQKLDKADRLIYGDSAMTHAMNFTAVTYDEDSKPCRFRVENSWGEDQGEKGYLILTAEWFKEFVFEVVVDQRFVSEQVLEVFKQTPKVLPAWDPLGSLAKAQ